MSTELQRTVTGVEVPTPPLPSASAENPPARATTTSEQDLESASQRVASTAAGLQQGLRYLGQRRINLLWEVVQGIGGLLLIATCCYGVIREKKLPAEFWLLLGVVVNSYYTRTNHTKTGGVGGTDSR